MAEKEKKKGITVKKEDDMAEWYQQVCLKADVAEYGPTKGTYILKPLGYALWQNIMDYFNSRMSFRGVQNAYFPMFIPESFFHKEATHAKGFSPEVAWIEQKEEGEERIALRPTSETIMYDAYSRWIRSWRDLPLRINQWANIVRWETEATKLFLRSREFLWQEGHCVYETEADCDVEVQLFLMEYVDMCRKLLALPLIFGRKTEKEKFAGAKYTMTIEAFMPDGKALQAGTSHNLGQGFSKAFNIQYLDKDEKLKNPWQSSWGVSTRLIGAMIMTHSDNKGLVLPPTMAPNKIVIIPIIYDETRDAVLGKAEEIRHSLFGLHPILDSRDEYKPGWKFAEHEMRGVPLRIEIGPKDLETNSCIVVRRDTGEKQVVEIKDIKQVVDGMLADMQSSLYKKAEKFLKSRTVEANDWDFFLSQVKNDRLVKAPFCGEIECEESLKDKTAGVSSRVIPLGDERPKPGTKCINCDKEATVNVYWARSY